MVYYKLCITCVCVCVGEGVEGKIRSLGGASCIAGGEAGREGMCNVYKTIDGGVKSI